MRFTSVFGLAISLLAKQSHGLAVSKNITTRATSPAWTFDSTGHFNLTLPNKRWALVHTPPNFDKTQAHPLVLAFHGAVANAQTMEAISNLSNDSLTINGMGIVVVYGEGTTGTNGGNDWQGAPYSSGANDISYVQNILAAVRGNLTIDNTRIYAAGFSNGGGFVNLLACTPNMAPTFAAFATSSPALYSGTRSVSGCDSGGHPVALIDFHGLADDQIPYAGRTSLGGDTSYALPDIDDWRQQWAERAGCGVPSSGSRVAPSVMTTNYLSQNTTSYRWNCARATIIGYTVQTMGHWWLTAGGGFWDETPLNIINFFNARTITNPF